MSAYFQSSFKRNRLAFLDNSSKLPYMGIFANAVENKINRGFGHGCILMDTPQMWNTIWWSFKVTGLSFRLSLASLFRACLYGGELSGKASYLATVRFWLL